MSKLAVYSLLLVASTFVSSVSQIMLKKSSQKQYPSKIKEYLNPLVISAYGIFFLCTLVSMYSLKVVPLSLSPVLESTGYIFVGVLSYIFMKEKMTKKQIIGMVVIIAGIMICYI